MTGLHVNMFPIPVMDPMILCHQVLASIAPSVFLDEADQKRLRVINNFGDMLRESGYMHLQATKPDTVGKICLIKIYIYIISYIYYLFLPYYPIFEPHVIPYFSMTFIKYKLHKIWRNTLVCLLFSYLSPSQMLMAK